MKFTEHIAVEEIKKESPRKMVIEEDSFLEELVDNSEPDKKTGKKSSSLPFLKGLRFILIMAALIVSITFVLNYSFIYLKDIILNKNELSVNSSGAFTPKKSIGREYGIYLFNTAELWANSGIRINQGDRVRISISGGFHSSYADLLKDAETNAIISNRWMGQAFRDYPDTIVGSDNELLKKIIDTNKEIKDSACLYNRYYPDSNKVKARLGDVLYEIVPEYVSDDPLDGKEHMQVWSADNGKKLFEVNESGYLRFAINDIYFQTPDDLREYAKKVNSLRFGEHFDPEEILKKDIKEIIVTENDNSNRDTLYNYDFRKMFYMDNIGQILVCVEIQHPFRLRPFNPLNAYRYLEKHVNMFLEKNLYLGMFLSFVYLVFGFLPWIAFIFIVWTLAIFAFIFIVYLLFFGLEQMIIKIKDGIKLIIIKIKRIIELVKQRIKERKKRKA